LGGGREKANPGNKQSLPHSTITLAFKETNFEAMEPLSALSVAAAAIQFLDFGARLLGNTLNIYRSPTGQTKECVELSAVSRDLQVLATQIQGLCANMAPSEQVGAAKMLQRLSLSCKFVGDELHEALAELRASGVTKLDLLKSSFNAALKALKLGDKIQSLQSRMQKLRTDITGAIMVCLWYVRPMAVSAVPMLIQ